MATTTTKSRSTTKKAPQTKKLAKIPKKMDNLTCFRCGEVYERQFGNFSKVRSTFYEHNGGGYLHVCSKCTDQLVEHYKSVYDGDYEKTIYTLCLNFNLYFSKDIYEVAAQQPRFFERPFQIYVSKSNMSQYRKWRDFTDTLDQESVVNGDLIVTTEEIIEADEAQGDKPSQNTISRWGVGYTKEEYDFMNALYRNLKKQRPDMSPLQDDLVVDACKYKCQHNRLIQCGESKANDIKTLSLLYQDNLKAAGLDASPKDEGLNDGTFGTWVREIERFCPAEDYENQKKYHDYEGIGEYCERFIFRPLKNWLTGSKDKDKEFFLGEEDV